MESIDYANQLSMFFSALRIRYAAASSTYKEDLKRFFTDFSIINSAFQMYKKQADRFLSSDFSFFDYLSIDENAISDYIALMLDRNASHGQNDLFLKAFLEFLVKNGLKVPAATYNVHREYWANGRIDIFLQSEDTAIIIENKPYAGDQENQLSRYIDWIRQSYKNVFVVYLSPGSDPSETSIPSSQLKALKEAAKFITIPLSAFGETFLASCTQSCESQKFRFFIEDFRSFLITKFELANGENNGTNK